MVRDMVRKVEKVGKHELDHRHGAVGGDVGNGNAAFPGCHCVNDVVPRCHDADVLQPRHVGDHIPVERRLVREYNFRVLSAANNLLRGGSLKHLKITEFCQILPAQIATV